MPRLRTLPFPVGLALALACSGDAGPDSADPSDGSRLATQFENLADQAGDSGASATANALRHAAQIVRLVGHATPLMVTIDGVSHNWLAVAEQLDYPVVECVWPAPGGPVEGDSVAPPDSGGGGGSDGTPGGGGSTPPDTGIVGGGGTGGGTEPPGCTETGTSSVRSIIAWEPDQMSEVVRMTAEPGSSEVKAASVPDVMAGLPTPAMPTEPGDTAVTGGGVGSGGTYGFVGEYFKSGGGTFWTVEGTQTNSREAGTGSCTESHTTFDWAEFDCEAARLRFELTMRVEGGNFETGGEPTRSATDGELETHAISIPATSVDAAVLTVVSWSVPTPEPGPGPEPVPPPEPGPPVDSSSAGAAMSR
jgi:hypothetical protein